MFPTFDGHNDILLRLFNAPQNREAIWLTGEGKGHLDLPRMKTGGFVGGFFAIYIPSPHEDDGIDFQQLMENPPFRLPLPKLIPASDALPTAWAMANHMLWMERASSGRFKLVTSVAQIRANMAAGIISGILHMEGAEAIGPDLDALYAFHALGLRSIGPVWSRPTIFGHGVPFAFPSTPDTGEGLTEPGKRLIKACNELKVMIDLSHINEKGFDDVAALSTAPLVATHSNAHVLTQSSRNLTDRQLGAIKASNGMVGLNYATSFLRRDGKQSADMGWEDVLAHLDHLIEHAGEDHVGLGSDFDGATIPKGITDVAGLPNLQAAMQAHGYSDALMRKITHENWLSLLERTWGG
jgi:membrane dipeptidase